MLKDIEYVPGLYKIFDEILVNAADNKVRDPKMDKVEVTIDPVSVDFYLLPDLQGGCAHKPQSFVRAAMCPCRLPFGRRTLQSSAQHQAML